MYVECSSKQIFLILFHYNDKLNIHDDLHKYIVIIKYNIYKFEILLKWSLSPQKDCGWVSTQLASPMSRYMVLTSVLQFKYKNIKLQTITTNYTAHIIDNGIDYWQTKLESNLK